VLDHQHICMADEGIRGVEYVPEPGERSILSAVDPTVFGFQDEWRSEVMGWAPLPVEPVVRTRRSSSTVAGSVFLALVVAFSVFLWQQQWLVVQLPLPDSEWAFESTGIRSLQASDLTGDGVRVCMVDTGIDPDHDAFSGRSIVFHDLVGTGGDAKDYGAVAHGTLMSGLLLAGEHQLGSAPNVTFAMVAALKDNGNGENTGLDSDVADGIRWCQFTFEADIISLSLGGSDGTPQGGEGESSIAARQATDAGIYVIAAAGNDGGGGDDGDVASPGSVPLVISVGALERDGTVWDNSSSGSLVDRDGLPRTSPNQKPEVVAPGVRIISSGNDNQWYSSSGTSDATVFVTGALALILEAIPSLKPGVNNGSGCLLAVKDALAQASGEQGVVLHDIQLGYGPLDADRWYQQSRLISGC